jgi:hypothetical protein
VQVLEAASGLLLTGMGAIMLLGTLHVAVVSARVSQSVRVVIEV